MHPVQLSNRHPSLPLSMRMSCACRPLMEAHAHAICSSGGDVLNVGFGMGLVDEVRTCICHSQVQLSHRAL